MKQGLDPDGDIFRLLEVQGWLHEIGEKVLDERFKVIYCEA